MSGRGPVAVVMTGVAVCSGLLLALAGCFALGYYGLWVVALGAGGVAGLATAVLGEERSAAAGGMFTVGLWLAAGALLVAGVRALAGGMVTVVVVCLAGIVWAARSLRLCGKRRVLGKRSAWRSGVRSPLRVSLNHLGVPAVLPDMGVPVSDVPTPALGREWLRTTAALESRLDPEAWQLIVRRRGEALDELERRDPAGFSRWLANGQAPGSDPAQFVRPSPGRKADDG